MKNKLSLFAGAFVAFAISGVLLAERVEPEFEVASIKPTKSPLGVNGGCHGRDGRFDSTDTEAVIPVGRCVITAGRLSHIMAIAYRIDVNKIGGRPDWEGPSRFDIEAKAESPTATQEELLHMLQALLADRFKLTYHRDTRDQSIYALIVGKGGPKLVESPPDPPVGEPAPPAAAPQAGPGPSGLIGRGGPPMKVSADGRGAFTIAGRGSIPMRMSMTPDGIMRLEAERLSISVLVDTLTRLLDRPVVDQTGLKGAYKMTLELAPDDLMNAVKAAGVAIPPGALGAGPGAPGGTPAARDPSGGSTIFRSVEQLGLKLDARKMPVEQIVIDHLERVPTED